MAVRKALLRFEWGSAVGLPHKWADQRNSGRMLSNWHILAPRPGDPGLIIHRRSYAAGAGSTRPCPFAGLSDDIVFAIFVRCARISSLGS